MPEISIFTSEGEQYGSGSYKQNDDIQGFFFDGVRLAAEFSHGVKIICFFRAHEDSGRSEQYYAIYNASRQSASPFDDFVDALYDHVEGDLGLQIDTNASDTETLQALSKSRSQASVPGNDFDRSTIDRLLGRGERLRVGVKNVEKAMALGQWALDDASARSFVIADNSGGGSIEDFDLKIETGTRRGIEPLGDTARKFESAKQEQQSRYVDTKVSNIRSEISDLRSEAGLSSGEIRRRLRQDIDLLEAPKADAYGGSSSSQNNSLPKSGRIKAVVGVVGVVAVVAALIIAVAFAGIINVPVVSALVNGGGDAVADNTDPTVGTLYGVNNATETENGFNITDEEPTLQINSSYDTLNISIIDNNTDIDLHHYTVNTSEKPTEFPLETPKTGWDTNTTYILNISTINGSVSETWMFRYNPD